MKCWSSILGRLFVITLKGRTGWRPRGLCGIAEERYIKPYPRITRNLYSVEDVGRSSCSQVERAVVKWSNNQCRQYYILSSCQERRKVHVVNKVNRTERVRCKQEQKQNVEEKVNKVTCPADHRRIEFNGLRYAFIYYEV